MKHGKYLFVKLRSILKEKTFYAFLFMYYTKCFWHDDDALTRPKRKLYPYTL